MSGSAGRGEFASFPRHPLTIVRGSGAHLWADDGRRYVDLGASHGTANMGHAHPRIVAAIAEQAQRLIQLAPSYGAPSRTAFVDRLFDLLPPSLDRVYLSNSGTESVEAAIKFARSATGRPKVVAARRAFHGRTMGSLSATWRPEFRAPFEPLVPGFVHVPFNDAAALEAAVDEQTALVLLEPVQGEGGVHVADPGFLAAARRATERAGALLAFDEVQSGLGRTGRTFAFEHSGVVPDLLTLGKSLAGGLPVGATITTAEVERRFRGSHQSTFGGNPVVMAAADAALAVLVEEHLADRAARLGDRAIGRLRSFQSSELREVRGVGLLIGLELKGRAAPILERLRDRGYLALAAGANVIRLLPPLVIDEADWEVGIDALGELMGDG